VVETLDLAYAMHWPYQQRETMRGIRRSPLHEQMAAAGAVFGEVAGWERANWFAPAGADPRYDHSYGKAKWFEHWAAEHRAVREQVGLFDLSSFGKISAQGRDAGALLQQLSANDVDVEPGRTVYTQWLNERGGIEADVTVTRVDEQEWLVLTAAATVGREMDRLRKHIGDSFVTVSDVSAGLAMLSVMGPRSRELLQGLTDTDLAHESFGFGASRRIDLGATFVRATRLTYVGELGWELLVPADQAVHVYRTLAEAGAPRGLRHAGYHALNSLRMEKAYRSWGHDIGWADTPLQAGLGFAVAWDKPGGFVGRDALLRQRDVGVDRLLVQLAFDDPEVLAYHDEPIYRDGVKVGKVASASYGWTLGASIVLGYVGADHTVDREWVESGSYEIEVANQRHTVTASLRPMYDPTSARIRC
jgi:4-methylaminobutanoate oxidase (formaldehyde-forming)